MNSNKRGEIAVVFRICLYVGAAAFNIYMFQASPYERHKFDPIGTEDKNACIVCFLK